MKYISKKIFLLTMMVALCTACFNFDDYFDPLDKGKIFKEIIVDTDSIAANGESTGKIIVRINDRISPAARNVIFKTSLGTFEGDKGDSLAVEAVRINGYYESVAELTSLRAGNATVTIEVGGVEADTMPVIKFKKEFPTAIASVSVDSFAITNNFRSEVNITALLVLINGKPSVGHPVAFTVLKNQDNTNDTIGAFVNGNNVAITNSEGKAQIRYSAGEVNYRGYLTIKATTKGVGGKDLPPKTTIIYLSNNQ